MGEPRGYLVFKKADKTPETETATAQQVVNTMLAEIQKMGNLLSKNMQLI